MQQIKRLISAWRNITRSWVKESYIRDVPTKKGVEEGLQIYYVFADSITFK